MEVKHLVVKQGHFYGFSSKQQAGSSRVVGRATSGQRVRTEYRGEPTTRNCYCYLLHETCELHIPRFSSCCP